MRFVRLFFIFFMFFCLLGCEEKSNNKNRANNYEIEETVFLKTEDNHAPEITGDLGKSYRTADGIYRVITTTETIVMVQRPSHSGWDQKNTSYVRVGRTCIIYFTSDEIDWSKSPHAVRPFRIDVYDTNI